MMNIDNIRKERISYAFLRVIFKFFEIDRKTRFYGTDTPLFYAEIHLIKAIKENEGIHITGLAQRLGVTKGAVSQMLFKLEKKGFIIKEKDATNQSRFLLKLTPKGEIAHENHMRLHREFDNLVNGVLIQEEDEQVKFLKRFLIAVDQKLGALEEEAD
ncbi:MAG: MarR family transcriptional regulator [Bacillota bacterium]|jgi:DNA-binding MarR family transcriptional regulator